MDTDPEWEKLRPEGEGPWHVIHASTLMSMLERAHKGEDPDMLYIEEYANARGDD